MNSDVLINQIDGIERIVRYSSNATSIEALAEKTVSGIAEVHDGFLGLLKVTESTAKAVEEATYPNALDPNSEKSDSFERCEEMFLKARDALCARVTAAEQDPRLNGRAEGEVTASYTRLIETVELVVAALQRVKWAIWQHDSRFDERLPTPLNSLDDLLAELKS